jgi:hypothetical protein
VTPSTGRSRGVLDALKLSPEQRAVVPNVVRAQLAAISAAPVAAG